MTAQRVRSPRTKLAHLSAWVLMSCCAAAQSQDAPAAPRPAMARLPGPSLDQALKGLDAARSAASKMKINLTCAVVDARGDIVALSRMDGAPFFTATVAEGKALASALFGQPSGAMAQMAAGPAFASFNASLQNRILPVQGAVPIVRDNTILGGVGCSGASSQQDEDAAKAALAAM
jgi:uncharacterized protein GlcG (DUF336 family)